MGEKNISSLTINRCEVVRGQRDRLDGIEFKSGNYSYNWGYNLGVNNERKEHISKD